MAKIKDLPYECLKERVMVLEDLAIRYCKDLECTAEYFAATKLLAQYRKLYAKSQEARAMKVVLETFENTEVTI